MNTAEARKTVSAPATVNVYLEPNIRWTREGLLTLMERIEAAIREGGVESISIRSADARDFRKGQRHWPPSIFFIRKNVNPEKTLVTEIGELLVDKLDREAPLVVQCIFDVEGGAVLEAVDRIRMIPDLGRAQIELYDIFSQGRGLLD